MGRSITKAKQQKNQTAVTQFRGKEAVSGEMIRRLPEDISKLYADGGATADYINRMVKGAGQKCSIMKMTEDEVRDEIFAYFDTCQEVEQPPTIGGLALWFSATITTIQRWATKEDPKSFWFSLAMTACQQFAEIKAMDGSMNPIVYIYQNKAYHGFIETQRLEIIDGGKVLSIEEVDAVIDMLPDEDGVYRVPKA